MTEFKSPPELSKECQQALYDLILVLADSKHLLGLRYGEWLYAPAIEASIASLSMAQDELGHARLFYNLVEEFLNHGFPKREEKPSEYRSIELLDHPFPSWPDFVAVHALVDLALSVQLEAFEASSYLPLRRLVPKILQEEEFHFQHAKGWLLRIASASERAKAELERAVRKIWTPVLCWLGKPESTVEQALVESQIQDTDSEGLRTRFIEKLGPILQQTNLHLPVSNDAITGQWVLGTELSWKGWNEATRRFSRTGPDLEIFAQIESFFTHEYPVT